MLNGNWKNQRKLNSRIFAKKKKKEERERDFNAMLVLNNEMSVIKIDFYIFLQSPLKTATGCSLDLF